MVGTFNGNPLAMAATRAMLTEVATPGAYQRIERIRQRAAGGIQQAIDDNGLTAHVVTAGAKGCVVFSAEPVENYRGFLGAGRQVTATRTGSTSTTAGSSCRPGARSSSG